MMANLFAGRSSLHRLHQTVQRNILHHHKRNNVRWESTRPNPPAQNASNIGSEASKASIPEPLSGQVWSSIKLPFRAYGQMQKRRPLLTQWQTALVIYFLGDLSAQSVQTGGFADSAYEPDRGLRAIAIGAMISIPSYKWFLWLGRQFNYPSHLLSLACKICFSQCFFTPVLNTYFFGMQSLLSGSSLPEAWERVKKTVPVSWVNSWKLWPAVTAVLFTWVPPHNRSVCAGIVAIFWQTYLSWLNRKAEVVQKAEEDKLAQEQGQILVGA